MSTSQEAETGDEHPLARAVVPKVPLSSLDIINSKEEHWLLSYITDQLYTQMCETDKVVEDSHGKKFNPYYFEAGKYAGLISAGDFGGRNAKHKPTFSLDLEGFSPRLKAELAKLSKESLDRVVIDVVFRILKARHKMIFYQYIECERLRWRLV
jgi:hypothetical protein